MECLELHKKHKEIAQAFICISLKSRSCFESNDDSVEDDGESLNYFQQLSDEIVGAFQFNLVKIILTKNKNFDFALRKRLFCDAKLTLLPCKTAAFGM
ncbi:hypothetical protein [Prevotella intermedia]|uniref:Uncharacterized protein n=1 Tax=Prevotella intermedia TaxID=28131 RepID=A0A2M8TQK8_PREIN|nr:hypothetical protein [Prevotella intermedia]PJI26213.1 hypothetical protein CTM58_10750 [Prevotella intermedia]